MEINKVSVIVCTRNRVHAIVCSLEAIATAMQQAAGQAASELVVIDNGSTDGTSEAITKWASGKAVNLNLHYESRPGLSVARNTAMRLATGDLFIFTDDDCVMAADYIEKAVALYRADTELVMRGGRVELGDPADLPLTIKTDMEPRTWRRSKKEFIELGPSLMGANMVYPSQLYKKLGDYDECMGAGMSIPAGEDTDYIYRAYLADAVVEYNPDLVVHHFHGRREVAQAKKLLSGYAQANGALCGKYIFTHPDFVKTTYWDIKMLMRASLRLHTPVFHEPSGFTYANWLGYSALGLYKYVLVKIKKALLGHG